MVTSSSEEEDDDEEEEHEPGKMQVDGITASSSSNAETEGKSSALETKPVLPTLEQNRHKSPTPSNEATPQSPR